MTQETTDQVVQLVQPEQELVALHGENELQTAMQIAMRHPRDLPAVVREIALACGRPALAEGAIYSYPRGGATISGPSIKLARELQRAFGHIVAAMRVIDIDDKYIHIQVMARDLQKNNAQAAEDKFERKIWKRNKGKDGAKAEGGAWVKPDEREQRELINRRAALLERNCLLKLLPADMVDDALQTCRQTMQKAARGELKQSRSDTVRRLSVAFLEYGVNKDRIEEHLAHPLEEITDAELGELRQVYASIADGHTRPGEHFPSMRKKKERKPAPGEKIGFARADELERGELVASIVGMLDDMVYDQIDLNPLDLNELRDLYTKTLAEYQDWLKNNPPQKLQDLEEKVRILEDEKFEDMPKNR